MRQLIALLLAGITGAAFAQTPLKVKMFPGAQALPALAAASQGIFQRHGLAVEILFTVNSDEQRAGLAKGEFEIAQAAVDNAVAMVELAREDVVIVTGGDSSMNEFIVQPDVRSFADLKGSTLLVDAPNTAYALQLKKILLMNGLKEGADYKVHPIGGTALRLRGMRENKDYKAAMLNLPFSLDAKAGGLKSMGRATDLLGSYQANGTFVMRKWGQGWRRAHPPTRISASRPTPGSTCRGSATCSRYGPRSRGVGAERRRHPTGTWISAITKGR